MGLMRVDTILKKYGGLTRDSRDDYIHIGDYILLVGSKPRTDSLDLYYGYICKGSTGKNEIRLVDTGSIILEDKSYYIIVLPSDINDSYVTLARELVRKGYNLNSNIKTLNYIRLEDYKQTNNVNNTRGYNLSDMFNRPVSMNDFVYYCDPGGLKCGIVISSKHVFTQDKRRMPVKHVLLMSDRDMTGDEREIKKKLTVAYRNLVQKELKSGYKELMIGDIYADKNKYYLYLGKCKIQFRPYGDVVTRVSYEHDSTQDYWLYLDGLNNKQDINQALNDENILLEVIRDSFWYNRKAEKRYAILDNHLKSVYYDIIDLGSLIELKKLSGFSTKPNSRYKYIINISPYLDKIIMLRNKAVKT